MKALRRIFRMLMNNRGQVGVEEADGDTLAAEVYAEMEAEKAGVAVPGKKKEEIPPADEPKPEEEGAEEGEKIEPVEEEGTEGEEGKPEEEPAKPEETPKPKTEDERITEHAQKYSMTYAEAKEDIEKTARIIEQFKNDPAEMARAIRNKDREFDKLKTQQEKSAAEAPKVFQKLTDEQFRQSAKITIDKDPDKYISAYRNRFPAKSDQMSEEAIIEDIIDREWIVYQGFAVKEEHALRAKAQSAREAILSGVADADKKYIPDLKAMLAQVKDQDILSPEWNNQYLLWIAKGKNHDAEVAAAYERGKKEGSEAKRILGVKDGGGQKPTGKSSSGAGLNDAQKDRAEEMFSEADGYTKEDAHKMFKETFASELAKDKNFI